MKGKEIRMNQSNQEMFRQLGISEEVYKMGERVCESLKERFEKIDQYLNKSIWTGQSHCRTFFIQPTHRHLHDPKTKFFGNDDQFEIKTKTINYHA